MLPGRKWVRGWHRRDLHSLSGNERHLFSLLLLKDEDEEHITQWLFGMREKERKERRIDSSSGSRIADTGRLSAPSQPAVRQVNASCRRHRRPRHRRSTSSGNSMTRGREDDAGEETVAGRESGERDERRGGRRTGETPARESRQTRCTSCCRQSLTRGAQAEAARVIPGRRPDGETASQSVNTHIHPHPHSLAVQTPIHPTDGTRHPRRPVTHPLSSLPSPHPQPCPPLLHIRCIRYVSQRVGGEMCVCAGGETDVWFLRSSIWRPFLRLRHNNNPRHRRWLSSVSSPWKRRLASGHRGWPFKWKVSRDERRVSGGEVSVHHNAKSQVDQGLIMITIHVPLYSSIMRPLVVSSI